MVESAALEMLRLVSFASASRANNLLNTRVSNDTEFFRFSTFWR